MEIAGGSDAKTQIPVGRVCGIDDPIHGESAGAEPARQAASSIPVGSSPPVTIPNTAKTLEFDSAVGSRARRRVDRMTTARYGHN
jgi:hypothetical protein